AASGGAYAYWAGTVNYPASATDKSISITVGEATGSVSTQLVVSDPTSALKLVPSGQAANSTGGSSQNVEYKDYTYEVKWQTVSGGSAKGATAKLTMNPKNFEIGTTGEKATLGTAYVKVQYHNGTDWADIPSGGAKFDIVADASSPVTVQIRVTLLEPADAATYAKVANQAISIKVDFSVAVS
ncbi:MAG TPA: hypothetical protein PLY28_02880, partial [Bacilli bacterium]|nr:hypothetical protein [Bacilli bacterium]